VICPNLLVPTLALGLRKLTVFRIFDACPTPATRVSVITASVPRPEKPERPKFTLLRSARPGLLNQKRQVVNPILLTYTARIDHVREVIFAVGEYKIGVRHGVVVV